MNKIFSVALVTLALSSCAYYEKPEEGAKKFHVSEEVKHKLGDKPNCCLAFDAFDYKKVKLGKVQKHKITPRTDAFTFRTGKSYFVAYSLPQEQKQLELNIKSIFAGTFFYPKVLVLDEDFNVTRSYSSESFEYVPHGTFDHGSMQGKINLSPSDKERFLIVLTTDELRTRKLMTTTKGRLHNVGEVAMYEPTATKIREPSPEGKLHISFTDTTKTL